MARIRQNPRGVVKKLGAGLNFRVVRRAKLAPGVKEVKNPTEAWRLR